MKSKFALVLGAFLFLTILVHSDSYALGGPGGGKCKATCPDGSSCESDFNASNSCMCKNGGQGPAWCIGFDRANDGQKFENELFLFNIFDSQNLSNLNSNSK